MRRREFFTLFGGAAVAWPLAARGQSRPMPTIGWLGSTYPQASFVDSFREGLKSEGFVENQNVAIQYRWADGQYDRLPGFAAEFVQQRVHLIAAITTASAMAAKPATQTIPVVFLTGGDPVQLGLVSNLNQPAGNRTGLTLVTRALDAKRLELIRELVPTVTKIAVLLNPNSPSAASSLKDMQLAAQTLGQQLRVLNVTGSTDISPAFATLVAEKTKALIVSADSLLHSMHPEIVKLAASNAIPAVYEWREIAEAGGLISYGPSSRTRFVRSAFMPDASSKAPSRASCQ